MLKTQVQVSKDTGEIDALYVWEDTEFPWQVGFIKTDGAWTAWVEHKEQELSLDLPLSDYNIEPGHYPTLYAAMQAYLDSEYAAPSTKNIQRDMPYGIVLG